MDRRPRIVNQERYFLELKDLPETESFDERVQAYRDLAKDLKREFPDTTLMGTLGTCLIVGIATPEIAKKIGERFSCTARRYRHSERT